MGSELWIGYRCFCVVFSACHGGFTRQIKLARLTALRCTSGDVRGGIVVHFRVKRIIGLLLLGGIMALAGCGVSPQASGLTSAKSPSVSSGATTTKNRPKQVYITKSDLKIGHLFIGQTFASVQATYGPPTIKTVAQGNGSPQWDYPRQGFKIVGPKLFSIAVTQGFVGQTPRGIDIGSTERSVLQAYPMVKKLFHNTQLFAASKNDLNQYNIDFELSRGVVTEIIMNNEKP